MKGPTKFERQKRIAAGCVMDAGERRPRRARPESVVQQVVDRSETERAQADSVYGQGAGECQRDSRLLVGPLCGEESDPLPVQSTQRELDESRGGFVEPLRVVNAQPPGARRGQR